MAGADMDPSQYTYALDRLSAQDKVRLWCSVSSLWPMAPQWPTMPQPCPQWPSMAPCCPPAHPMWAQHAPVCASGTPGTGPSPSCFTELQHSSSCVTGTQEVACTTPSLQQRLSIDAVGGCASSCGTATAEGDVKYKDGSSTPPPECKAQGNVPCENDGDHLFQLFDVFSEEDMASSLVSTNDSMNTGALNNIRVPGLSGNKQELPLQPTAAGIEHAVASPALPPSPLSSAPSSEQLPQLLSSTMPHPAYHLTGCASEALNNPITSAASIPARPASSNPMAPAASLSVPGAVVSLASMDDNKPARTVSMPVPNSPAASTSKVRAGGVKKPTQEAAARRKVQATAAVAASKGSKLSNSKGSAPTFLGGCQPSVVRGVGVSGMMAPSAFAPFAMDPMMCVTPTTLMGSSGGVFSAAAIMSLNEPVEEDHATDVLLTTNSSMCPALSWMEDVTLQGPAPSMVA